VRRFNETFRRLFGRPPATLRRTTRTAPRVAGGAVTLYLPYVPPYDFAGLLGFLEARAIPGVESVKDGRYCRTIASGMKHGTLSIEADSPGRLKLTVQLPALTELPQLLARVRRLLDLSADPVAIGAHLAEDPLLGPLVRRRPGLRVPGAWDGFELAVRAVLGQQITVVAATRLAGKLAELCGDPITTPDPALCRIFPSALAVARADLTRLGVPRARARTITALAEAVADDPSLLSPGHDLVRAVERLRAIPGVGEWTAQYVAMRELREPDAFPAADIGVLRALERLEGTGASATAAKALARAEAWRPWRAYAAVHLWASLSDVIPRATPTTEKTNGRRVA
jgi:AraC family transcriptional regulator of adaptative response / DNA-3-methyladenine glycosylase II